MRGCIRIDRIIYMKKGFLTNVRLTGIWGNINFEWNNIDPEVNILVGINGSGKTSEDIK